jgi:hypothetical protein
MPTIEVRPGRKGQKHYRVKIRCAGMVHSATFPTLAEARHWAYVTEGTLRSQRDTPWGVVTFASGRLRESRLGYGCGWGSRPELP